VQWKITKISDSPRKEKGKRPLRVIGDVSMKKVLLGEQELKIKGFANTIGSSEWRGGASRTGKKER